MSYGDMGLELCRLVHQGVAHALHGIRKHEATSGCSAAAAHLLWEPQGRERRRVGVPEHDRSSGEGADYCAVREHNHALCPT